MRSFPYLISHMHHVLFYFKQSQKLSLKVTFSSNSISVNITYKTIKTYTYQIYIKKTLIIEELIEELK